MSLVSCIMADMQYTMATSDCEDKAANIAAKLKSTAEQGSEIGKMLANLDSQMDEAKSSFRELGGYQANALNSQDPRAQQALGLVQQRQAYCNQMFTNLQQRKTMLEAEKRRYQMMEKELTAEQTKNDVMKKLNEGMAQKFKGYTDGAIKRFTGGGQ